MSALDHLLASAREGRADWSADRAERVFAVALERAERAKTVRRSAFAAGVVVAVAFVLLRAGTAPAASTNEPPLDLVADAATSASG